MIQRSIFPLICLTVFLGCFDAKPNAQTTTTEPSADAAPRETVGKTTQVVVDLKTAMAEGAVLASTKIESKNPLMQSAEAYRTQVGKIGGMAVSQAIQLRNASSIKDPKPLTHTELMSEIIKPDDPNGIRLPMLPYYQEYAWDESAQALVVVDFPARQEEREKSR